MDSKAKLKPLIEHINNLLSTSIEINNLDVFSDIERDLLLEKIRLAYNTCLNLKINKINPEISIEDNFETQQQEEIIKEPIIIDVVEKPEPVEIITENITQPKVTEVTEVTEVKEITEIKEVIEVKEKTKEVEELIESSTINYPIIENTEIIHKTTDIKEPKTIADKFKSSKTINDTISQYINKTDLQSLAKQQKIDDLNRAFGVNDKFRFANSLFDGNIQLFNQTIWDINLMANIDEAIIYISDNYKWNTDDKTVQEFIMILQRRFK